MHELTAELKFCSQSPQNAPSVAAVLSVASMTQLSLLTLCEGETEYTHEANRCKNLLAFLHLLRNFERRKKMLKIAHKGQKRDARLCENG